MPKYYDETQLRATIKDEENLLLQRLFVIRLIDLLAVLDPPFYDPDKDEIAEPFKSIFDVYSIVDDDEFINSIEAITDARNEAYKTISQKKKTRRVKPKTKPTKKTAK